MRNGIDLKATHSLVRAEVRAQLVLSLALIALCAGCNAIVDFGDFEFGKGDGRDSGTADSGLAADGGEGDSGPRGDGGVKPGDGGAGSDGSVSGDAATGMDSGVQDAGDVDSGNGGTDSGVVGCHSTAEVCDNGVDDDCDRLMDCADPDCTGVGSCCSTTPENTQSMCSDNRDNDCSGQKDCADLNCSGTLACCTPNVIGERTTTTCSDGIDDDCDGKIDCADTDCAGLAACCGIMVTSGGGGTTSACCTPDGSNEVDQPNDGKDNDCDGLTDIPVLQSAFPTQGLPASADEVQLTFMTEIDSTATLSCSTQRAGQPASFAPCLMSGMAVKPFSPTQSADSANDGIWITQVRWDFPGGRHSATHTFRYYVHRSLNTVAHCTPFHTDKQWFDLAATRLGGTDAGAFRLGVDTFLTSPFFRVKYQVPTSGNVRYKLNGETPSIDMWSLRRRFVVNSTNRYLLITRNYKSLRNPSSCAAASIRVHITHWGHTPAAHNTFHRYSCDAIVLNRAGVGVCMDNGATSAAGPIFTATKDSWDSWVLSSDPWQQANKFMWRNLMERSSQGLRNFSTKCAIAPCTDGLYLPDRSQFSP
jgi:hypothetical protein